MLQSNVFKEFFSKLIKTNTMQYPILGDRVTIISMANYIGSVFTFTGSIPLKFKLPNKFYFQMPDNFAHAEPENVNEFGYLTNTIPESPALHILSKYLAKCILSGRIVNPYSSPFF